MPSKFCVTRLLGAAILLPIAIVVLGAFARLLRVMGDAGGSLFLERAMLAAGILWVLALIGLLLVVAMKHVGDGCSSLRDEEIERDQ